MLKKIWEFIKRHFALIVGISSIIFGIKLRFFTSPTSKLALSLNDYLFAGNMFIWIFGILFLCIGYFIYRQKL